MYQVVNTETGEVLAGPFATVKEAAWEMHVIVPPTSDWDGHEVPLAVEEETHVGCGTDVGCIYGEKVPYLRSASGCLFGKAVK